MRRFAILTSLLASGLLMGHDVSQKLSRNERIALETSSPRVHVGKMHKNSEDQNGNMTRNGYRVVKDKHTINAFVPVGK